MGDCGNHRVGPVRLVTRDVSDGINIGSAKCVMLARIMIKDESWLQGTPTRLSLEPRVSHRKLDVRANPERVASLIQWWVRFGDGLWRGDSPEGPPAPRRAGDPGWCAPDQTDMTMWWWHGQLIFGMLRELAVNGWSGTDVSRSLYRARASTQARCQTQAIRRRDRFLARISQFVAREWDQVQASVVGRLTAVPSTMARGRSLRTEVREE